MKFYSTNRKSPDVTLREAILAGLAPDSGLYMPRSIPTLKKSAQELAALDKAASAVAIAQEYFSGEVPEAALESLIADAINFAAPLVRLNEDTWVLELFHGPTLAFKDFGARFMARVVSYFIRHDTTPLTILAATSGDTGSAVADGFYGVEGVQVVVLYPKGKVSRLQEQQLTTLGGNIVAFEVEGTFDDCQSLVKQAFIDSDLRKRRLSSANSINIARLIPQSFYYAGAFSELAAELGANVRPVFSVPSGNFGNLTAGVFAKRMGIPILEFVAATNANDVVVQYLNGKDFTPRPSVPTLSNAMDVGNPSNFARLQELYAGSREAMRMELSGASFDDQATLRAIKEIYSRFNYTADPHTAVAWLGLEETREKSKKRSPSVILSTAHPGKFIETMERALPQTVKLPPALEAVMKKEKQATVISKEFGAFKERLWEHTK